MEIALLAMLLQLLLMLLLEDLEDLVLSNHKLNFNSEKGKRKVLE